MRLRTRTLRKEREAAPAPPPSHTIKGELLHRQVRVALVGCGGNGSQMLTGLARLHVAMLALGHPAGLHVTVYDPDQVSESNVGRQLFSSSDVGQYKAVLLVHRVNCFFGLDWTAVPTVYYRQSISTPREDLVITCVDTARARREIHQSFRTFPSGAPYYWLDMGNGEQCGQVILGQPDRGPIYATPNRLPTWGELHPEALAEDYPEENKPSCSLAEALKSQGLFVNQHMATWSLTLLERLFRYGRIQHCGYWINLESGRVNPVKVPVERKGEA